jgi:hypothetical protein
MYEPDESRCCKWFARRNGTVRGPFTADHLKRCILLGRVQLNDELSLDESHWRPLADFPELFPEELAGACGPLDYQRLLAAHSKLDERIAERRHSSGGRPPTVRTERRRKPDRRNGNWLAGLLHLNQERQKKSREMQSLRTLLLATLIASLVLAYFSISSR